ncbi:glycoside hydrolase family 1 protein [Williamsoniiplasma lucivorax]|uniref:6-phospho-beta-glucosidase n=1 Tax=Williamsoniiplasma lucivorax TaxID=209274 RepID=A0A2S5R9U4_9MOLU|nr:glycoside hydrolase family 1 protein [Williamsoniiplasma lucivorax]PPE04078.1 6-phospho-beta-glucosidase [Williamsoniiplasma lucivorax]
MKKIREDFLWGGSSSAFQIEGGWNEDGKEPSVQDTKKDIPEGTTDFKIASDHYHHWKEDVAMMVEMGFKSYRFSIAWTRVWSYEKNQPNQKGLEFYHNLIDELLKHKIEPIVTMYHFDLPDYLQQKGGWLSRNTIDEFAKYTKLLMENYGAKVKYWLTINEQNIMALASGAVEGGKPRSTKDIYQCNHHMFLAQAKAMKIIHQMSKAKVGPAPNITAIYPNSNTPEDNLAAITFTNIRNWYYLDVPVFGKYNVIAMDMLNKLDSMIDIQDGDMDIINDPLAKPDFIGFNYYATGTVKQTDPNKNYVSKFSGQVDQQTGFGLQDFFEQVQNPNLPKTQFNWEIDPVGFKNTMLEMTSRYNLPLLLTENGIGGYDELDANNQVDDQYRIDYYTAHLKQMLEAIAMGVDLIGYNPWTAIDLVSTHEGIRKRYGFVFVNRTDEDLKDLKRYPKKSFYWYKEVIKTNGKNIK